MQKLKSKARRRRRRGGRGARACERPQATTPHVGTTLTVHYEDGGSVARSEWESPGGDDTQLWTVVSAEAATILHRVSGVSSGAKVDVTTIVRWEGGTLSVVTTESRVRVKLVAPNGTKCAEFDESDSLPAIATHAGALVDFANARGDWPARWAA